MKPIEWDRPNDLRCIGCIRHIFLVQTSHIKAGGMEGGAVVLNDD